MVRYRVASAHRSIPDQRYRLRLPTAWYIWATPAHILGQYLGYERNLPI